MFTYKLICFDEKAPCHIDRLALALKQTLIDLGLDKTVDVQLTIDPTEPDAVIGVYFGSEKVLKSDALTAGVVSALDRYVTLIPVVSDLTRFYEEVPQVLHQVNGFELSAGGGYVSLASLVLRELGITESRREIFISYRRVDGTVAAEQTHNYLDKFHFRSFIDQFHLEPGVNVQNDIRAAIERFPLLVVLETPRAHESEWVFDEVNYALSHRAGLVIVTWPGNKVTELPLTHGLPRLMLRRRDFTNPLLCRRLKMSALRSIHSHVETEYARTMVIRRKALVSSAMASAQEHGWIPLAIPGWSVIATSKTGRRLLMSSVASTPQGEDLYSADEARACQTEISEAHVIHETQKFLPGHLAYLNWIMSGRMIELTTLTSLDALWRRRRP